MNNFYVQILGSSAAIPTSERACSSQLVYCNNRYILIDCGEGTQMQIRKFGIPLQRISHILISHLHGDHFYGLPGLLGTMSLLGRNMGLNLYGPPELLAILKVLFRESETRLSFNFNFIPLTEKTKAVIFEDEALRIYSFPLKHRIKTYGFSIEEKFQRFKLNKAKAMESNLKQEHFKLLTGGKDVQLMDGTWLRYKDFTLPKPTPRVFSYCSDTITFPEQREYLKDTSTLYHEATFLMDRKKRAKETFHSTALDAATLAKEINVKSLLMGHFSSRYANGLLHVNEAKQVFDDVVSVEDGCVYPVI